jgi:hypothetical protein
VKVHWWLFWKRNEFLCSTEQEKFLTHVTISLQESFCSLCLLLYIEMLSGNYGLQCHNRSRTCINLSDERNRYRINVLHWPIWLFCPLKLLLKSSDICVGDIGIVKWTAERGASEKTKFILSRSYRSVDSCCNRLEYGSVN